MEKRTVAPEAVPSATPERIFPTEPIRYPDAARWSANNGFRLRWLANGAKHAAAINRRQVAALEWWPMFGTDKKEGRP